MIGGVGGIGIILVVDFVVVVVVVFSGCGGGRCETKGKTDIQ